MMWRTHLAGGIALTAGILLAADPNTGQETLGVALISGAFGSLLPDLDAMDSKIRRFAPLYGAGKGVGKLRPFALPATVIHATFGHRGAFHSLAAVVLTGTIAALLSLILALPPDVSVPSTAALVLGFLSHLLLDACTPHGVPILLPFTRRRYHVLPSNLRVTTAGIWEDLILAFLVCACFALLLPRLGIQPELTIR